jgi:hypothetical protein
MRTGSAGESGAAEPRRKCFAEPWGAVHGAGSLFSDDRSDGEDLFQRADWFPQDGAVRQFAAAREAYSFNAMKFECLFFLASCRHWDLAETINRLRVVLEEHSIVIQKLDTKDPPRRSFDGHTVDELSSMEPLEKSKNGFF